MPAIEPETAQAVQLENVTAQQTEHLLIVSIGPVQDFIAAARKCQDLWFGSFLLSELARSLARELQTQGAVLVFPGSKIEAVDKVSVANKVVAKLPGHLKPRTAVKTARAAMDGWLGRLRACAFDAFAERVRRMQHQGESIFLRGIAEKQVADLIELQWVAVPITSDYSDAHEKAERLLAWRKNTRDFGSVPWEAAGVPKSSIDGQRESVIRDEFFKRVPNETQLGARFRLGKNERLCGVGILKRFGTEILSEPETDEERALLDSVTVRPIFHSNSHVAAGPLLARIEGIEGGKRALEEYASRLRELRVSLNKLKVRPKHADSTEYDGTVFYPDRLHEVFEEASTVPEKEQPEAVRQAQIALQTFFKELKCSQSEPYYVMLQADGDHMGAAIRELTNQTDPIEKHRRLSDALACFAERAIAIVEDQHNGSLIYSGGDDVLALLPLHTALACAQALSNEFVTIIERAYLNLSKRPTLSVGLAVVHHLEHMGRARNLARDAEKLAKRQRNSLAIIVDKRSGGTFSVGGTWDEQPSPLPVRIEKWMKLLHADELPDGVAFELLEMLAPFEVPSATQNKEPAPREELRSLVTRILGRKRSQRGQQEVSQDVRKLLDARLSTTTTEPIVAIRELSYEIQIAREFLRAQMLVHAQGE